MRHSFLYVVPMVLAVVAAAPVSAQVITADGPVVYGHHHFNTTDMAAQKRFFVDTLGGKAATIGTNNTEVIEFPNVFLFFRPMQKPTGGTIGTTVNHVGFSVPDLKPVVAKLKANGYKMITSESVAATVKITDDIAAASPTTNIAFTLGPEDIKVELVEVKAQTTPIQLHHVHFFGEQRDEMQAWYAKGVRRDGEPGEPGQAFVTDQLPGVTLSFSPSADADGRHAGPSARSHRLRGQEPRGVHEEARGRRHPADRLVPQSGRARHRDRLHQGSLGHEHRADRGAREDQVAVNERSAGLHPRRQRRPRRDRPPRRDVAPGDRRAQLHTAGAHATRRRRRGDRTARERNQGEAERLAAAARRRSSQAPRDPVRGRLRESAGWRTARASRRRFRCSAPAASS